MSARSLRSTQNITQNYFQDRLTPVPMPGRRNPSTGVLSSAQDFHRIVASNAIIINRAARAGFNIQDFAYGPLINQPRPIIGTPGQAQIDQQEEQEQEQESSTINIVGTLSQYITMFASRIREQIAPRVLSSQERRQRRNLRTNRVLEQNINTLFTVNNDLLAYLNADQLLYLTRGNIINDYYYRRLELHYTIPFIEKFNNLAFNILTNMYSGVIESGYRYDIEYFNTVQQYYISITGKCYNQNRRSMRFATVEGTTGDVNVLKNKNRTVRYIMSRMFTDISKEKIILHNYIRHLDSTKELIQTQVDIEPDQRTTMLTNIDLFKFQLNKRLTALNKIKGEDLVNYLTDHEHENKRKNIIIILKSLSILCLTFMIIIYKIKFFVNSDNYQVEMETISSDMYKAIDYYNEVINKDINMNNAEFKREVEEIIIIEQENLFSRIKIQVTTLARIISDSGNTELDFSIYFNNNLLDPQNSAIIQQSLRTPEFELSRENNERIMLASIARARSRYDAVVAERLQSQIQREIARENNLRLRDQRRHERQEALAAARQERQAALAAARQERQAALAAARQTRQTGRQTGRQQGRQPGRQQSLLDTITITSANITKVDSQEFDNKITSGEINDIFKTDPNSIISKLKTKYNEYNRELVPNKNKEVYTHLRKKYEVLFNYNEPTSFITVATSNYVGHSIPSLFARYLYFEKDMKFNDLPKYMVVNHSIFIDENGDVITTRQSGIDVGGLRRDFITALTNELFDTNNGIFITREGTKKYFLNPRFKYDDYYKHIIHLKVPDYDFANFKKDFYIFLGNLILFILVNDCGLEHNLSSYLTALLYKDPSSFDEVDYLYFMMDDFPEYFTSILNLLKMSNPNDIEHVCIGFNDYYNLSEDNSLELKAENIEEYLYKCSEFMMKKTMLRKDIDINSSENYNDIVEYGKYIHEKFNSGISSKSIRVYISETLKIPLLSVNSYLIKPIMSDELIIKLKDNFIRSMSRLITRADTDLSLIKECFVEYILTYKSERYEIASVDSVNGKDKYFKFIDKLLRFWSGSSFYKETESYKIKINEGLSTEHLPQSHTCFFTIDLPKYTGTREEIGNKLYSKIEMAITNVESGIGLAGGKPRQTKNKKMVKK